MHKITISLDNLDQGIEDLNNYIKWVEKKKKQLTERLAEIGAMNARISFSNALYAGDNDVEVEVSEIKNGYVIKASGQAVLFIEFGTGILNPEHPQGPQKGYIHGSYGKGQGKNPKGWVYQGSQGNAGQTLRPGVYHTCGNPPSRSMYDTAKLLKQELVDIAKEVFSSD